MSRHEDDTRPRFITPQDFDLWIGHQPPSLDIDDTPTAVDHVIPLTQSKRGAKSVPTGYAVSVHRRIGVVGMGQVDTYDVAAVFLAADEAQDFVDGHDDPDACHIHTVPIVGAR